MKVCISCGKDISGTHGAKKRCDECQYKYNMEKNKIQNRKYYFRKKCFNCDTVIQKGRFCSDKCEKIYNDRFFNNNLSKCVCCQKQFKKKTRTQVYCSRKCREIANRIRAMLIHKGELAGSENYRLQGFEDMSESLVDFLYQEFWVQGEQGLIDVIMAGRRALFGGNTVKSSSLVNILSEVDNAGF